MKGSKLGSKYKWSKLEKGLNYDNQRDFEKLKELKERADTQGRGITTTTDRTESQGQTVSRETQLGNSGNSAGRNSQEPYTTTTRTRGSDNDKSTTSERITGSTERDTSQEHSISISVRTEGKEPSIYEIARRSIKEVGAIKRRQTNTEDKTHDNQSVRSANPESREGEATLQDSNLDSSKTKILDIGNSNLGNLMLSRSNSERGIQNLSVSSTGRDSQDIPQNKRLGLPGQSAMGTIPTTAPATSPIERIMEQTG